MPAESGRSTRARIGVAVSGGMDSMSLLHCTLAACRGSGMEVLALHVHHGLLEQADQWEDFVRRRCRQWAARGLPVRLRAARLNASPSAGASIEAWARTQRYAALSGLARDEGVHCVLLAQHRDDQVETVLLQALRGAGPAGLSGMPASADRGGVRWLRPWLAQPRSAIEAYARKHRLTWVEDPSNLDERLGRGRLRRIVLPALRQAFPGCDAALCAVAARAQEASRVLDELAALDLASCELADGGLSVPRLLSLTPARQANLLRRWLRTQSAHGASQTLIDRLLNEVPAADAAGKSSRWPLGPDWIQLHRQRVAVQGSVKQGGAVQLDLSRPGWYPVPGWSGGIEVRAIARADDQPGLAAPALTSCTVRARLPADRFQFHPASSARALKKQFQARGIGPLGRLTPLVASADGQVLFVPGLGHDARTALFSGPRLQLRWIPEDQSVPLRFGQSPGSE